MKTLKPLGGKSYGSIPHLPGSRLGPGDHHCEHGQAAICLTKARDRHDKVIVTEKLDGSNVAVANHEGKIIALTRAGYLARSSKYEQHHLFADWVEDHVHVFGSYLGRGERLVGEWLAQAHGTRYSLAHKPFVAFDLIVGKKRLPYVELLSLVDRCEVPTAALLHAGVPCSLEKALDLLGEHGCHGALDPAEGVVWRVERHGEFDFMAKFVRHDKQDGTLLPEISGKPTVWNWHPTINM